jgi:uncharacterized delta-60 repeat protein
MQKNFLRTFGARRVVAVAASVCCLISAVNAAQVTEAWAVQEIVPGASGHEPGGLATDAVGNVLIAGYSYFSTSQWDIVLSKYSPTGMRLWQNRFDAFAGNDFAQAMAVNGTNLVVTASSLNPAGDYDFVTLKYSPEGALLWSARYDGPGHGLDFPDAVAADAHGNVVMAGSSSGLSSGMDFAVLKYNAAGTQLWVFRYDGGAGRDDRIATMRMDTLGNIYLTGTADQSGNNSEIITIKINSAGEQVWAARWTPPPNTHLKAEGLALDGDGNVVVVGTESFQCLTLKYSPSGDLLWAARYHAEEPAPVYAFDVRIDSANNIVTGANIYGSGTNDALLVKYNSAGQQLWASRIPHPLHAYHMGAMDMDAEGSTYLTGSPHNDMMTVKVAPNGNQVWSAIFNSTGLLHDFARHLTVDNGGNVIVAGRSVYFSENFVSVAKYTQSTVTGAPVIVISPTNQLAISGDTVTFTANATGTAPLFYQWRFTGRAIAGANGPTLTLTNVQAVNRGDYSVVVSNSVALTVSAESRLTVLVKPILSVAPTNQTSYVGAQASFVVTYQGTAPFTFQWRHEGTNIPGATNNLLQLNNVALSDAGGYSVVVGNPAGSVTSAVVTLNVSMDLQQLAVLRYNGTGNKNDENPFLHVTPQGEKIVVATSEGLGTQRDIVVLKYSASNELLWTESFHRGGLDNDVATDSAIDGEGNIYITGWSGPEFYNPTCTTLKYSPGGQLLWARHFRETNDEPAFGASIAVGPAGNVTVAADANSKPVVLRYAADGDELWVARVESEWFSDAPALAVDAAGNSYLATTISIDEDNTEFFLRKLDSNGEEVWARTFDGGWGERIADVLVDRMTNVVVAASAILTSRWETVVFKYSADGNQLWFTNILAAPGVFSFARALVMDHMGEVLVASALEDYDDDQEGTGIAKLSASGEILWTVTDHEIQLNYVPRMALDHFGNLYVTGSQWRPATGFDAATAKYSPEGNRVWLVHYAGAGVSEDYGTSVGVDSQGDVYVAGESTGLTGAGADLLLVHYRQQTAAPAPRIVARRHNGCLRLMSPGGNFTVEVSSDLKTWAPLEDLTEVETLLGTGVPLPSAAAQRFYRFVWETK